MITAKNHFAFLSKIIIYWAEVVVTRPLCTYHPVLATTFLMVTRDHTSGVATIKILCLTWKQADERYAQAIPIGRGWQMIVILHNVLTTIAILFFSIYRSLAMPVSWCTFLDPRRFYPVISSMSKVWWSTTNCIPGLEHLYADIYWHTVYVVSNTAIYGGYTVRLGTYCLYHKLDSPYRFSVLRIPAS